MDVSSCWPLFIIMHTQAGTRWSVLAIRMPTTGKENTKNRRPARDDVSLAESVFSMFEMRVGYVLIMSMPN